MEPSATRRRGTALTSVGSNRVLVRGYSLDELMGRATFGEAIYLLLTGELPTPSIRRLIDALLVGAIDDGPAAVGTVLVRPAAVETQSLAAAVARGVSGYEDTVRALLDARQLLDDGLDLAGPNLLFASAAADFAEELVQADRIPPPGYGHAVHTADPRATRLLQIATELETEHLYTEYLRALAHALAQHPALADERLAVNLDGALAAVTADLGLAPSTAAGLALIARAPGLVAHAIEAAERSDDARPDDLRYDGPSERRLGPDSRR